MRSASCVVIACLAWPVAASAQAGRLPAASIREDIAGFRAFIGGDNSFSDAARSEMQRRLAALEAAADTVSPAWFELEIARLVALADNGHSNAQPGSRSTRFNRIPVRMTPLTDGFYVLRAHRAHGDLLGARLVAIDDKPVAQVRTVVHTLFGGTPERRDRFAPYALESPQQLQALGVARDAGAATYRFQLADGRLVERRIAAEPPDVNRPQNGTARWMYPAVELRNEPPGWRPLLAPDKAPWALQDINEVFRWRDAPEIQGMVVELRQIFDAPGKPIADFLASVEAEIRRRNPRHVVIDLRINGGGNLNTARDFMRRLPTLVPGRIFVLTSPYTFSAAISSLGYLEQAAPDKVTIVGEPVGDRLMFWAEGGPATLRHSGIAIGRATERHDYANGCRDYTDCHGPVVRNPIAVRTLAPDIPAPWTIEAYRAGRDPGMEAIAAALR